MTEGPRIVYERAYFGDQRTRSRTLAAWLAGQSVLAWSSCVHNNTTTARTLSPDVRSPELCMPMCAVAASAYRPAAGRPAASHW
jgi:hypothetical protein